MAVDYKFSSITDDGVNTTCVVRYYTNDNGNPPIRSAVIRADTVVLSGSKALAELQTYFNDQLCGEGEPSVASQQNDTNYILAQNGALMLQENEDFIIQE